MKIRYTTTLIFLAATTMFALTVQAWAQISGPDPMLTLSRYVDQTAGTTSDEAVGMALAANDDLLSMRTEVEAAKAMRNQAAQRARPTIGFEGRQQVNGRRNRSMVMGSIPLELGGRRSSRIEVADREADFTERLFAERERRLAEEVRKKFGETLARALKLRLTEEVLLFVLESYDLVREQVAEGKTAPLEENMMLVEVNRLRSMRERDEGMTRVSMLELKNLLGLDPVEPLLLKGDFQNMVEPLLSLSLATDNALLRRTDLQALKAAAQVAEAKIEQSKREGGIDASLNLGFERMTDNFPYQGDNMVIFGLMIQLPYGNRNRDAIAASVLDKMAAEQRLEFGELIVRREVAAAFARYEYAVKALEIYRLGVTGEAFRNLEVIRQTYELGSSSLIDYLGEQRRYVDYRSGLIDAQLEVYLAKVEIQSVQNAPELTGR